MILGVLMRSLLFLVLFLCSNLLGATEMLIVKIVPTKIDVLDHSLSPALFGIGQQQFLALASEDIKSLNELKRLGVVEYVEKDVHFYPLTTPNDPLLTKQWGVHNIQKTIFGSKRGEDSNLLSAWDLTSGSDQITIAVIDSGIDIQHPDLQENLWINRAEQGGIEGVDDDHNGFIDDIYGYDFRQNRPLSGDPYGHGTHCAGVIGAAHNNRGIAGVMPHVRLMGVKFFDGDGGTAVDAMKAISYAINNGATVLSNSWGGFERSQAMEDLIAEAGRRGVVFVAAAGNSYANSDQHPLFPASYQLPNVISVGSMTAKGKKSSFSNYGPKTVHLFAPGSSILSTYPGGRYEKLSGTSMAAPLIAGVVGLMQSLDSSLKPEEVRSLLISTSKQTKALKGRSQSDGHIDAAKALESIL